MHCPEGVAPKDDFLLGDGMVVVPAIFAEADIFDAVAEVQQAEQVF